MGGSWGLRGSKSEKGLRRPPQPPSGGQFSILFFVCFVVFSLFFECPFRGVPGTIWVGFLDDFGIIVDLIWAVGL